MPVGLTHHPSAENVALAFSDDPEECVALLEALGKYIDDREVDKMKGYYASVTNLRRLHKIVGDLIAELE